MDDYYIIIISLLFSALFSGTEIAYLSTNRLQLELDVKKNKFAAKIIDKFIHNQSKFIGCLLLGNNIANVIYGIAIAKILEPKITGVLPQSITNELTILLCQTIISTFVILIVGEFIPKILFRISPNKMMSVLSIPILVIYVVLYPLNIMYIGISELLIRYVFRQHVSEEDHKLNMIDLNDYLKEYSNPKEENEDVQQGIELFQNAIEFPTVKLRECMVPRTDIESVRITDSLEEIKRKFEETKHSKLLVYEDNIDNIIGYIHFNDIINQTKPLGEKIRSIEFYPETYGAQQLLRHLSKKRLSIAVVVDEFGGTSGIITIEDLIEEIFGEIEDEFDIADTVETEVDENDHIFSARLEIDHLNKTYHLSLPESDDYETLAGYVLHYHESIPKEGEEIAIGDYLFIIKKATKTKLEEIEIKSNQ